MIEFLRMRQHIKYIENERLKKLKQKEIALAQAKRKIPLIKPLDFPNDKNSKIETVHELIKKSRKSRKET